MMPESTSPVPAVASRASPAVTTSAAPVGRRPRRWSGPSAARPRRARAARRAGGGDAVGAGRRAGEHGELAVVGREHGRAPVRPRHARRACIAPRANSPSPSTTTGSAASATSSRTPVDGGVGAAEARARRRGRGTGRGRRARPGAKPVGRQRPADRPRWAPRVVPPRRATTRRTIAGPGPLGRARREVGGAEHARASRPRPTPPPATCGCRRAAAGSHAGDVGRLDEVGRATSAGRPMSATSTVAGQRAARARAAGPASGPRT